MDYNQKKQKKVEPESPARFEEGDAWIYTCVKRRSYFFVGFAVGKWTQWTCREMLFDVARRVHIPLNDDHIQFFSDGNDDYTYVLPDYFRLANLDYAQLVKIRKNGMVVGKAKRIVYGSPDIDDIETTDVENFNGILRERVGRLVRKTKCFSKLKYRLTCALQLVLFYWNFMSLIRKGITPAMVEGIVKEPWAWKDFFYAKLGHTS